MSKVGSRNAKTWVARAWEKGFPRVAPWLAALVSVIGSILVFAVQPASDWTHARIKDTAEALALIAAGAYFLQRWTFGYFFMNLSVHVSADRVHRDSTTDWLMIQVELVKGDRGAIAIHDAQVRVTVSGASHSLPLAIERLPWVTADEPLGNTGAFVEQSRIRWSGRSTDAPFLNLTPGEQLAVSNFTTVPREVPCVVDVAVVGKLTSRPRLGQWRGSVVSLPKP